MIPMKANIPYGPTGPKTVRRANGVAQDFDWTPDACRELEQLWATGLSASEIATRMGVSKKAIVGKARRLELPMRRESPAKHIQEEKVVRRREKEGWVGIWPPSGHCLFGIGDPQDEGFHFCAEPVTQRADGTRSSYCSKHKAMCYGASNWTDEERQAHAARVAAGNARAKHRASAA